MHQGINTLTSKLYWKGVRYTDMTLLIFYVTSWACRSIVLNSDVHDLIILTRALHFKCSFGLILYIYRVQYDGVKCSGVQMERGRSEGGCGPGHPLDWTKGKWTQLTIHTYQYSPGSFLQRAQTWRNLHLTDCSRQLCVRQRSIAQVVAIGWKGVDINLQL